MFLLPLVYCISKENSPKEISPGGKIKSRDNKGREQNADFVCNTLAMPDWDCIFHEVFCFQTILILAGKSVL